MALSQQLKGLAQKARGQAEQQQGVGQAQIGMQTQQAIGQTQGVAPTGRKQAAQQLATGVTQADAGNKLAAAQGLQQNLGQIGQQGLQQNAQAQQSSLAQQQTINEGQIADLQRSGQLRQNSAALKQSKQLQQKELDSQARLTNANMQFDNSLSFLTRKQREDLAELGQYTKQVLFDQRLTFAKSESGRKFTNMQQLADYSVMSFEKDEQLKSRMQDMQQANDKEIMALQAAQNMIQSKMKFEFQRAEKQKDYALLKQLQQQKQDLQDKLARKAARGAMITNVITGGAMIAGAVAGGPAGASAAGGAAQIVTGTAQSQGVY